ncbi:FtsX-like permease family protein [Pseudochryseolinea flava]|uniref:ABC3 transporter permease C-terminal domain-containing protein n=1 Tax=Pseudochryseolinea flava TaxID=2059302 RepID=A0A364XYK5_9BACT|nr:FtsX-like permease family protein [Pseudochryseolinea flava]RAV98506.1 hypothetical protein DQQ10_23585 [Pseudochryseolinea flava]
MRALLNKIFLRKLGIGKFTLSGVAFLVGFTLVLLSLQGYFKLTDVISPKKNPSNYIILNKEVGFTNTIFGARAQFTPDEILEFRKQTFLDDFGVFRSSQFQATAHLGGDLGFYTELFFESVPTQFIDNKPATFVWEKGDNFLPIIISQDFLNLYNFGYAMGKGTPQLSKATIQLVPLTVVIEGPGGRQAFKAKVVGFSERISSILVPEKFLTWANKTVAGVDQSQAASRVIVKLKSDQSAAFDDYIRKHSLKISDEKQKFNKILTTINVVMSVLVVIGTAFMIFALVIVMLNFSLMVAQAKDEVSLLLQLGYKTTHLVRHLLSYLIIFLASAVLLSLLAFILGNQMLVTFFADSGMDISTAIHGKVIGVAVAFVVLSFAVSFFAITRVVVSVNR